MASWEEKYEELLERSEYDLSLDNFGREHHDRVKSAINSLHDFIEKYEAAGRPDRDAVMPPD